MKKVSFAYSTILLAFIIVLFSIVTNAAAANKKSTAGTQDTVFCLDHKPASQKTVKFLEKYFGSDFLSGKEIDFASLGLTADNSVCRIASGAFCRPGVLTNANMSEYEMGYSLVTGIVAGRKRHDSPFLQYYRVLDDRYSIVDAKRAIYEQTGLKENGNGFTESLYQYCTTHISFGGRYYAVRIIIYGVSEKAAGPKNTTISYELHDQTNWRQDCIASFEVKRLEKEKSSRLHLD